MQLVVTSLLDACGGRTARRTQCKTVTVDASSIHPGFPVLNNLFKQIADENSESFGACCMSRRRAVEEIQVILDLTNLATVLPM